MIVLIVPQLKELFLDLNAKKPLFSRNFQVHLTILALQKALLELSSNPVKTLNKSSLRPLIYRNPAPREPTSKEINVVVSNSVLIAYRQPNNIS